MVADIQKSAFRTANPGKFINTGVWTWSRHPNYAGEIVLWIGQVILASGSFTKGADWFAILYVSQARQSTQAGLKPVGPPQVQPSCTCVTLLFFRDVQPDPCNPNPRRSPLITTLLLTKVSGIPMLEKSADAKWGADPAYQRYKLSTPVLFPFLGTAVTKERTL